jgi:hypothetical protein
MPLSSGHLLPLRMRAIKQCNRPDRHRDEKRPKQPPTGSIDRRPLRPVAHIAFVVGMETSNPFKHVAHLVAAAMYLPGELKTVLKFELRSALSSIARLTRGQMPWIPLDFAFTFQPDRIALEDSISLYIEAKQELQDARVCIHL